jgi:hypothetical protein
MKALFTLLLTAVAVSVFAQKPVDIEPYTSLVISRGVDVRLVKSNSNVAKVEVNGIDFDDLIIENKDNELTIKVATKSLWQEMQDNYWWARIELPYDVINNLEVLTGAKLSAKEVFKGEDIDMQVSMGGEIELDIDLELLIIDASMGGLAEFTGKAKIVEINASMGSETDLRELEAEEVNAKSTMGSEVRVHATKSFDGKAVMGGYIRVTGNPERFYQDTSMGGEISSEK